MSEAEEFRAFKEIADPSEKIDDRAFAIFQAGAAWARTGERPELPPGVTAINSSWFLYKSYQITHEGTDGFGVWRPNCNVDPICYRPTVREAMKAVDADLKTPSQL